MTETPDDRASIAQAWAWSSRITSVALEMVLPAVLGHWLDQKLGTVVVFLLLGLVLGMTAGLYHLIKMVQPPKPEDAGRKNGPDEQAPDKR